MPQTTCNHCNATYNSERELRDHLGTAHRMFPSEQRAFEPEPAQTTSFASEPGEKLDVLT
jgi:hypothetical protein